MRNQLLLTDDGGMRGEEAIWGNVEDGEKHQCNEWDNGIRSVM